MQVTAEDIQVISRLVSDLCGVVLDSSKGYLIENRLTTVAQEAGCKTFSELYCKVRYDADKSLERKIVDAITTNETLFFRDTSPFEALEYKALPELIDAKAKTAFPHRLRIWSAACSTGQEPYSIAMVLHQLIPNITAWDITILATDISDAAVAQASRGEYANLEIQRGMKTEWLPKYFQKQGATWKVTDELRALVTFRRLNLLEPFANLGPFDVIFCRNVVIYFSAEARCDVFNRIADRLSPEGYLFVGSSESLNDLGPRFKPQRHCRAVFYQPGKVAAAATF